MLNVAETEYYSRQLILSGFGAEAQNKLKQSKVLVAGAGGLGCSALYFIAGAGVGNITIADGDHVNVSNLHRQILYSTTDIGKNKAVAAAEHLRELNPNIKINAIPSHVTSENINELIKNSDVLIDATDNFKTRFLMGDVSKKHNIPLVFAAIFAFEGQLSVFNYQEGPCLRDVFSTEPEAGAIPDCATNGVVGFVPGIMGCMQAGETIKIITGLEIVSSGKLVIFNLLTLDKKEFRIKEPSYTLNKLNSMNSEPIIGVSASELKEKLKHNPESFIIVDVRELFEVEEFNIGGTHLPLGNLTENLDKFPSDKEIVVVCQSGIRSKKAAQIIKSVNASTKVYNLQGGLSAWKAQFSNNQ